MSVNVFLCVYLCLCILCICFNLKTPKPQEKQRMHFPFIQVERNLLRHQGSPRTIQLGPRALFDWSFLSLLKRTFREGNRLRIRVPIRRHPCEGFGTFTYKKNHIKSVFSFFFSFAPCNNP